MSVNDISMDQFFPNNLTSSWNNTSLNLEEHSESKNQSDYYNGTDYYNNSDYYDQLDSEPIQFSLTFQIIIYILYNVVFITAVLGNVLVCYVVFSSPRMRTVTNYLIANLAVGDLLMAVLCVPFSYIPILLQYWPFGQFLCFVVSPAQAVCVFVSAYTLVVLAGDRYVAILYPLKPRLRKSQALIVIVMVWLIAIITAVPIAVFTRMHIDEKSNLPLCEETGWSDDRHKVVYSLTLMILQYFFPLGVLIFTYSRIAIEVWGKKAPGEAEDARDQRLAKAKRKMIKMMLMVVVVYTLSWLPFNCLIVYADLNRSVWNGPDIPYLYMIILWMALSHTVCNPIIYCWMNSRFREGFISTIAKLRCIRESEYVVSHVNRKRRSPNDTTVNNNVDGKKLVRLSTRFNLFKGSRTNNTTSSSCAYRLNRVLKSGVAVQECNPETQPPHCTNDVGMTVVISQRGQSFCPDKNKPAFGDGKKMIFPTLSRYLLRKKSNTVSESIM